MAGVLPDFWQEFCHLLASFGGGVKVSLLTACCCQKQTLKAKNGHLY